MRRDDVRFRSGDSDCAGWLYRPEAAAGEVACVVLAHGFGALKEARLDAFAERFAAAGHAALVFDYRHFGDSGGEPRQLLDVGTPTPTGDLLARRRARATLSTPIGSRSGAPRTAAGTCSRSPLPTTGSGR